VAKKKLRTDPWNTCDYQQECPYECEGVCKGYDSTIIPPSKEDLAGRLLALKKQKELLEEQIKQVNSDILMVEDMIIQDMITEEVDRFFAHDVFFYWRYDLHANVNQANKPAVIRWLKLNGYDELVIIDIDKRGFEKAVEKMLDVSETIPAELDELVNVYKKPIIRTRKSAKNTKKGD